MSWCFRRSFKLFPGVRLNLSRSGVSATVGVPGLHVTRGRLGTRLTAGLPGSGLSYSQTLYKPPTVPLSSRVRAPVWLLLGAGALIVIIWNI